MSEQKKPQTGEWWVIGNGELVRIIGRSSNGRLYVEYECGTVLNRKPEATDDWKHLPHCTGWDWQPEPEPEWFDLTPFGEHRLRKDIDRYEKNRDDVWLPIQVYDGATIDAMKNKWGRDQKFRCLLKDAPPELVAMANKPSEDTDEWVTQDRVPYRVGVDEFRYESSKLSFTSPWSNLETNPRMHGYVDGLGDRFQVRCRRRDLPPIPYQKPKTEHEVLLYWYDGNVVGRYADCPPTDQSFIPLIVRDGKVFVEIETREVVR